MRYDTSRNSHQSRLLDDRPLAPPGDERGDLAVDFSVIWLPSAAGTTHRRCLSRWE